MANYSLAMIKSVFISSALILLAACATPPDITPAAAPTGNYKLDPTHASVIWSLSHAGLSNYSARFDDISGSLNFDANAPQNSSVDIRIDPMSVSTGLPKFDTTIAAGANYFNAEKYPEIRFVSTGIKLTGENTGQITGNLSFRGITKPITLETTFNGAGKSFGNPGKTLGFSATTQFKRSDFGLSHLTNFGIGDEVSLRIETEFNEAQ